MNYTRVILIETYAEIRILWCKWLIPSVNQFDTSLKACNVTILIIKSFQNKLL